MNDHKEKLYSDVNNGLCLYHDKDSSWSWYGESSYSTPGGFGILSRFFGYDKTFIFGSYKRNDYGLPYQEIENKLQVLYYDYSDSPNGTMNYLHVRKLGEDIDMTFILYKNGNIKFTCGKINGSYVELEDFKNVTLIEIKDNKIISRTKYKLQ